MCVCGWVGACVRWSTLASVWLTGCFHEDGLADTFDGELTGSFGQALLEMVGSFSRTLSEMVGQAQWSAQLRGWRWFGRHPS